MSDVISGGLLSHLGPLHLALGSNHSIVAFRWQYFTEVFIGTRLQSKSFDTLDELLGFQVQKL